MAMHILGARNFGCDIPGQASDKLFCRVRCDSRRPCQAVAQEVCANLRGCTHAEVNRQGTVATLKAAPLWWDTAAGVETCRALHRASAAQFHLRRNGGQPSRGSGGRMRAQWQDASCDDFISGSPRNRTQQGLVFDIGFHSGEDTIYFLQRGYTPSWRSTPTRR